MNRIISVRSQKGSVPFQEIETDCTTFGELKMLTNGVDYNGCQGIILEDQTTLQSDDAKLPPYNITIYLTPLKVSNGGEDASTFFGNYSQMTTDQLLDVVKRWKKKVGDNSPTEKNYKELKAYIKAAKEGSTPTKAADPAKASTTSTTSTTSTKSKSEPGAQTTVVANDLLSSSDPMIQMHLEAAKKLGFNLEISQEAPAVSTTPVNEDEIIQKYKEKIAKNKMSAIDGIWSRIKKNFSGFIASL